MIQSLISFPIRPAVNLVQLGTSQDLDKEAAASSNHLIQPIAFLIWLAQLILSIKELILVSSAHLDINLVIVGNFVATLPTPHHHQLAAVNIISGIILAANSGQYSTALAQYFLNVLLKSCQNVLRNQFSSVLIIVPIVKS